MLRGAVLARAHALWRRVGVNFYQTPRPRRIPRPRPRPRTSPSLPRCLPPRRPRASTFPPPSWLVKLPSETSSSAPARSLPRPVASRLSVFEDFEKPSVDPRWTSFPISRHTPKREAETFQALRLILLYSPSWIRPDQRARILSCIPVPIRTCYLCASSPPSAARPATPPSAATLPCPSHRRTSATPAKLHRRASATSADWSPAPRILLVLATVFSNGLQGKRWRFCARSRTIVEPLTCSSARAGRAERPTSLRRRISIPASVLPYSVSSAE
ncbi:hypothetical protein C8R47DRAFT_212560 [Mycena vitilis]|nr:hypothetical protein C8R47DRAFT_212560 [Mycena vitilis]